MKKQVFVVAALASTLALTAATHPASAAQVSDNADCLGEERAERNSVGGDREKGGFGPAQSEFVTTVQPYGQWLEFWRTASPKCQ